MASKRFSQSADPVIVSKLPRADPSASFLPSKIPGTSSPVPRPASENHFSYKGSYFACPLQSPEGPEQPHLHYSPAALSQPVPAQGCLLHPPESPGTRLQPLDAQRSKDSLSQEQLMARKKLDSPRCPLPVKKLVVVKKAAPLAVPKPVYGAPASFLAPRMALLLGAQAEGLQQRPGEANWALPPSTHPLHPSEPHQRGPCSDLSLPLLPSSLALPSKEQLGSPVTLPHYCITFDKYRPPPSTPFLEAGCPSGQSQKVPEVPSLSLDPWAKLQPPDTSPVTRERSAMCYPPPPYPLSPHRAGPLCHPPAPAVGEPSALPGFGYVGSREPFPGPCLKPQAPRSYFPSPLEPYVPRTGAGRLGAVLRDAEPPRDAELPRNSGYPGFAVSPGDVSLFHASFPGCEQHGAHSPQWGAAPRHSSAFQPVCTSEKLSGGSSGLSETFPERGGSWEKPRQGEEEELLYPGRRNSSLASQDTPHGGPGEGNACKATDPAMELIRPSPSVTPTKELEDPRDTRALSSSPPMPVIHNVFSLAPYQEYLERARGSDPILFCRKHLWEGSSPQNTGGSQEPADLRDVLVESSLRSGSGAVQSQGESCCSSIPKKPKPVPQELESQEDSPERVGTEEPPPEDMVLDLSFKKRLVEAEDTQGHTGCAEGTLDQEDKEQKEAAGGKVGLGEGEQPRMSEADSGNRNNFQSSLTFMFQKYKMLSSLLPSTEPPRQDGSPHGPQPSPPSSSTPMPAPPASSPSSSNPTSAPPASSASSTLLFPLPAPQPSPPSSSTVTPAPPASSPSTTLLFPLPAPQPSPSISIPTPAPPASSPSTTLLFPLPAPQPSPPSSSMPTPVPSASSPSTTLLFPPPGTQLSTILVPNPPQTLLLNAPSSPGEEKVVVVRQAAQSPSGRYFNTLHTSLCDRISGSVSRSSPELLRQWLEKAESAEELGEMPKSLGKPKNGSQAPNPQKPSNGKEIWLAFQDVAVLLSNLLSQLKTFMSACPFPHVVRAGAIFIPIHVVKEKLFPKLPGSFVDQVLQKHKVELRPTTLSEEKHLRDLELKSCTSRMLKLLALRQLPEIYPDLLNLHWHNSIRQQLGSSSETGQQPSK